MKCQSTPRVFSLLCVLGTLTLTGCAGFDAVKFPNTTTQITPTTVIQGTVLGGHAPIVGAQVFLFETGQDGGTTAPSSTSLLRGVTAPNGVKATENNTAGSLYNGKYFVPTDAHGGFLLPNNYMCDPGYPVYLAAIGGSPVVTPNTAVTGASQAYNGTREVATFTTTGNLLYPGQQVTFGVFTDPSSTFNNFSGNTYTVADPTVTPGATLDSTHFSIVGSATNAGTAGPDTFNTTVTPGMINNTAIANLAMLGLCPSNGVFFGTGPNSIQFVFINEVSSAAMAYAMAGFATGPASIGNRNSTDAELNNIAQAAQNVANLYNIQYAPISTTYAGEGHIANATTATGVGIVPQATLDTMGNILAACVDSQNGQTGAGNIGGTVVSAQCSTLFTYATSNGIPTGTTGAGTAPADTFTAALNIVKFPQGGGTSAQSTNWLAHVYSLQGAEQAPFTPHLNSMPTDFTVAIKFPSPSNDQFIDLSLDASSNVWATTMTSDTFELDPVAATFTTYNGGSGNYVEIGTTGQAWTTNGLTTGFEHFTPPTTAGTNFNATPQGNITRAAGVNLDSNNYLYIASPAASIASSTLVKINNGGGAIVAPGFKLGTVAAPSSVSQKCISNVHFVAVDNAGNVWTTNENPASSAGAVAGTTPSIPYVCRYPASGVAPPTNTLSGILMQPERIAVDANGNGVFTDYINNAVYLLGVTATGNKNAIGTTVKQSSGGSLSGPFGIAVDGANSLWVVNRLGKSISHYDDTSTGSTFNSPAALSPTAYTGGGIMSDPTNVAVDGMGNVWVSDTAGAELVEFVGAGTPTVNPLSVAVNAGVSGGSTVGTQP